MAAARVLQATFRNITSLSKPGLHHDRLCVRVQHLRANLPSYEVGLYEQNALTFLMYTQPELLDNAVFDISSYGLNCWCAPSVPSSKLPYMKHKSPPGCQFSLQEALFSIVPGVYQPSKDVVPWSRPPLLRPNVARHTCDLAQLQLAGHWIGQANLLSSSGPQACTDVPGWLCCVLSRVMSCPMHWVWF